MEAALKESAPLEGNSTFRSVVTVIVLGNKLISSASSEDSVRLWFFDISSPFVVSAT